MKQLVWGQLGQRPTCPQPPNETPINPSRPPKVVGRPPSAWVAPPAVPHAWACPTHGPAAPNGTTIHAATSARLRPPPPRPMVQNCLAKLDILERPHHNIFKTDCRDSIEFYRQQFVGYLTPNILIYFLKKKNCCQYRIR